MTQECGHHVVSCVGSDAGRAMESSRAPSPSIWPSAAHVSPPTVEGQIVTAVCLLKHAWPRNSRWLVLTRPQLQLQRPTHQQTLPTISGELYR